MNTRGSETAVMFLFNKLLWKEEEHLSNFITFLTRAA